MTQSKSERNEQRRRILRAAAGAPVILTLPSGAALAANSVTCDVKSKELASSSNPVGVSTVAGSPDDFMRYSVQAFTVSQTEGGAPATVTGFLDANAGTGTALYQPSGNMVSVNPEDKYFYLGTQLYRVLPDSTAQPASLSGDATQTPAGLLYVLVDYTAYKTDPIAPQHTYVYPASSSTGLVDNPIAGVSCWNSLTGANLTSNLIN